MRALSSQGRTRIVDAFRSTTVLGPAPSWWSVVLAAAVTVPISLRAEPPAKSAEDIAAEQAVLNQLVYRDRRQQVVRDRAVEQLQAGNTLDGLAYLQQLLNHPEDGFVRHPARERSEAETGATTDRGSSETDVGRLVSVRRDALRILGSLDSARLRTYERLYGPEADRLLKTAKTSGDPAAFQEVARRFYLTAAGFEAVDWLATRWLDRGLYGLAARSWWGLVSEPVHKKRVTRTLLLKAAVAHCLADHPRRVTALLKRLGDRHLSVGGGAAVSASSLLDRGALAAPSRESAGWTLPWGNASRNRSVSASAPYLKPLWTVRFSAPGSDRAGALFSDWRKFQREHLQPLAVANSAVAVNGQVVVREFEGLRSLDLQTGRTLWTHACETSLSQTLQDNWGVDVLGNDGQFRSVLALQRGYLGNGTLLMPASDGERVYVVDGMDLTRWRSRSRRRPRLANDNETDGRSDRGTNRLIALDLKPPEETAAEEREPAWTAGGPADSETPLAGHFFLGPPLPVDQRLFVLTEWNRQLNLVALEPETGQKIWSQGLGYVDRPVEGDAKRAPLPASPSYAEGVLVCPTHLGILVGVDAIDGSLLWVYYYGDDDLSRRLGGWSRRDRTLYGHTGFPATPHIRNNRIVYLPPQSDEIHCIDLQTGGPLWRVPRKDGEYVGTVHEDLALIVGRRYCRGLSLEDGQDEWRVRLGMPSGRGLSLGETYLLPLEDGRVATIDLATGQEVGFTLGPVRTARHGTDAQADRLGADSDAQTSVWKGAADGGQTRRWWPGNLIACDDVILSVEPQQISAFPQAGALLAGVQDRLNGDSSTSADRLLAGELELQLGRFDAAKTHLTAALDSSLTSSRRNRAETLMRELLYLELDAGQGDELAILKRLARLSRTPITRGRYLIESAELQLRRGDLEGLLDSAQQFAALDLNEPLPMIGEPSHLISAASWVPSILGRMRTQFGQAELNRVHKRIDSVQQQVLASGDVVAWERFLDVYSRWPQAEAVRTRLAEHYRRRGAFQKCELLLLENRRRGDPQTAATATRKLVELWDQLGLPEEAAGMLAELDDRFGEVLLESGLTGHEYVMQFPRDRLTGMAYRRRRLPDRPIRRVAVSAHRWFHNDPHAAQVYRQYPRTRATPDDNTFLLLHKGGGFGDGELTIVDRTGGRVVGNVTLPSRNYYPAPSRGAHVGHFVPLGSTAAMHGVSLLQREGDVTAQPTEESQAMPPLWTAQPKQIEERREVMRVGPAGPSFCTFQDREHLVVVDPADGSILWQRSDLDPHCGLLTDRYSGLFGDEEILVLFGSNRSNYTVYRTATGKKLRDGRLDVDLRQRPRVFGRRFFYVTRSANDRRMRIWDPLTDRFLFDEPVDGRIRSTVMDGGTLVIAAPPDRLMIVEMETGSVRLDVQLPSEDVSHVSYLRAFNDHDRWYVNFWQNVNTPLYRHYTANTVLPDESVQGNLYALDKNTGRLLWRRTVPQQTVLRTPHLRLPFLITLGRVRGRFHGNQTQQALRVEVIDGRTGHTLGSRDDLLPGRILQLSYQPRNGLITLHGEESVIELDFSRARQRLPIDNGPL